MEAILLGSQFGLDLFQARANVAMAKSQSRLNTAAAQISGGLDRLQIRRDAEAQAADRRRMFAATMGGQRAALAHSGVLGGRTARLLAAQSQLAFRRVQDSADAATRLGFHTSEMQERLSVAGFAAQARAARVQANLDLLGGAIRFGRGVQAMRGRPD